MNLITQTYDADKWQLAQKVATDEMEKEGGRSHYHNPRSQSK